MASQTTEQQNACPCGCPSDSIFFGMCEFNGCPAWPSNQEAPPTIPANEPHLPDNEVHPPATSGERFKFSDEAQMKELAEGVQPQNTTNSTKWALKTYEQWCASRNSHTELEPVPSNLLSSEDSAELCKYLALFVVEARKKNGANYPPATLHQILCGILRHMRQLNCIIILYTCNS